MESSETKAPVLPEEVAAATDEEIRAWRGSEPFPRFVITHGGGAAQIVALLSRITADAERIERLRGYARHRDGCLGSRCSAPMKLRPLCLQPEDGWHNKHEYQTNCQCGLVALLGEVE